MKKMISVKASNREIMDICKELSKMDIDCSIESKSIYTEEKSKDISNLRIKIYGYDKNKIMENYKNIMDLVNRIHKKYNPSPKGLFEYRLSDIKYPINKNLILDALKSLKINYIYKEDENLIKCSLSFDEFNAILKELHDINTELSFVNVGSKPVRNIIVLVAYFTKKDIEDIIDECIEKEFFRIEKDKIVLNKDINLIKKHFLNE
ncbi:DUF2067 family protein [Methanothermococcus okinawensis]|nr:DUF2067 family protein [Methanothermococcus okinawensis]